MVDLDWDDSFSLQANVLSPGYQRIVLGGRITEWRGDGLYAASLLPQLFYGQDGNQLTTWRQNLTGTGQQTVLSRSGGLPSVPKQELYWKKIAEKAVKPDHWQYHVDEVKPKALSASILLPLLGGLTAIYILTR